MKTTLISIEKMGNKATAGPGQRSPLVHIYYLISLLIPHPIPNMLAPPISFASITVELGISNFSPKKGYLTLCMMI